MAGGKEILQEFAAYILG